MTPTSPKRVSLVTGGAGFIGSHLVEYLVRRGDHAIVIDNLATGRRRNLGRVPERDLTFIEAGVSEAVRDLDPTKISEIYHLAAAVGVRLVVQDPIHTIDTNVLETSAILDFATAGMTPTLIASTSEVYGKSTRTPFAEDDDVTYGPPTQPRWAYACSKAIDEHLALAHHRQQGLPVVIARFFNIVGPRQVGRYGMVLPRFVGAALADKPIQVYGDGRQTRCFCDVRDVVNLLPVLLAEPRCTGRIFNVGSDQRIEIGELAELVRTTLDSTSTIDHLSYDEAFGPNFDDLRHRQPDLTRLRQVTGFTPATPLSQTIRDLATELGSDLPSLESTA